MRGVGFGVNGVAIGLVIGSILGIILKTWLQRIKLGIEARAAQETIGASHWERLQGEITRLSDRVRRLEEENEAWRDRAITAEAEVARLQAIDMGQGEVRQVAAGIVAADRLARAAERERGAGDE